jgi:hypothetical protein
MPFAPRALLAWMVVALVTVTATAATATADMLPAAGSPDMGCFRVYLRDRPIGREEFEFQPRRDSLLVFSSIKDQKLPARDGGVDTLDKRSALVVARVDGDLRSYESSEFINGERLTRRIVIDDERDTAYTTYRETEKGGEGDRRVRPPGRVYVIDPQVYTLFDYLFRTLYAQTFEERPVTLVYMFPAGDTTVEARVKRLGVEPYPWGKTTLQAQRYSIADPWSETLAWVSPSGQLLRLSFPTASVRIERDAAWKPHPLAPPATKAPAPKKKRGG